MDAIVDAVTCIGNGRMAVLLYSKPIYLTLTYDPYNEQEKE